jgi:hypothetical protein
MQSIRWSWETNTITEDKRGIVKVKVKVYPRTDHESPDGELR